MLSLENPNYLYFLLTLPVLYLVLGMWHTRRKELAVKAASAEMFHRISMRKHDYFPIRRRLILAAIGLCIIAAANPRLPGAKEMVKQQAADLFIALDISNSMLATDIAPNRLERTKRFLVRLIDEMKGERLGIILFAGSAYISMPLTNDFNAAKMIIQSASTDMISTQGTALAGAIELAQQAFPPDKTRSKGLILISDGEDQETGAIAQAGEANKKGVIIATVGVGSTAGSLIPEASEAGTDFKRDASGQPVRSKLNEQMLVDIAAKADGHYYNIAQEDKALSGIKSMVSKLDKGEFKSIETENFRSLYQYFLFPALVLFLIEMLYGVGFFKEKEIERI
ncbi:MAG TPA: VWA domain-containing protein [Saprospiraceae bacterium]|nr:VWA domain-containing protein [Saprospiraceae bacterium]